MDRKILIAVLIVGALVMMPAVAFAGDLEDLKAASDGVVEAWNTLDAEKYVSLVNASGVGGSELSPFVTAGDGDKEAFRQMVTSYFDGFESMSVTPINYEYRIVGGVGVVYGNNSVTFQLKGGEVKARWNRIVVTYSKIDGKWQMVTSSAAPVVIGSNY